MKRFPKILFFCLLFFTYITVYGQNTTTHKVMPGETLYSIGKQYGVSVSELQQANKLENENIRASQVLVIPVAPTKSDRPGYTLTPVKMQQPTSTSTPQPIPSQSPQKSVTVQQERCKLTYYVDKKMSVIDLCKKFNVSEQRLRAANPGLTKDKLKKGDSLCIPYTTEELSALLKEEEAAARRQAEEAAAREASQNKLERINVAVILPFELSKELKSSEAIKMIDFYEGSMLAIDDLQSQGANINFTGIDESELSQDEIKQQLDKWNCHLIIGSKSQGMTDFLRKYSKDRGIPFVVPFSSRIELTKGYPTVFQVNSNESLLYNDIYNRFMNIYPNRNTVFVSCPTDNDSKYDPEYINGFIRVLSAKGRGSSELSLDDLSPLEFMLSGNEEIVLVPNTRNVTAFKQITDYLDGLPAQLSSRVTIFGYPQWQTFSAENTAKLRKYHCSYYYTFYADKKSSEIMKFNNRFKSKFNRDQYSSHPLYGLLGYDVTHYFLGGMNKYGKGFMLHHQEQQYKSLQNPMYFGRNGSESNGFVNHAIGIINM